MTKANDAGSFVVMPVPGGGNLIVSSNPASLAVNGIAQVMTQYTEHGATALLTLTTHEELVALDLQDLPMVCRDAGLQWWHAPIEDMGEPDDAFEHWWGANQGALYGALMNGQSLAIHCWSGYGRSGLVAARILIEQGMMPTKAIDFVRHYRPGAIETVGQERYVRGLTRAI